MEQHKIQPNIITYGTMLKGYCQVGEVERGFELLERMRQETNLKPDEIMYNSLLDGCAQSGLADEGVNLLRQMEEERIAPSNFTLSIVVKLMNRARRVDS